MPITLQAFLCLVLIAISTAADAPVVLQDKQFYTKGSFIAYAAPWSTVEGPNAVLKKDKDFANAIIVEPPSFPSNVGFSWHWPLTPPVGTGVYGYNAVSYGSYDGGVPEKPVVPRQVKDIARLSETFGFTMAHPIGDFNVLTEFFLADKSAENKSAEIGFFLHASQSAIAFVEDGEQIGIFKDATGREWKVASQPAPAGPYYMFLPASDVPSGTVDFKATLDFLRAKGKLTGNEWFHGLALGVEPVTGSGSLHLREFAVSFE